MSTTFCKNRTTIVEKSYNNRSTTVQQSYNNLPKLYNIRTTFLLHLLYVFTPFLLYNRYTSYHTCYTAYNGCYTIIERKPLRKAEKWVKSVLATGSLQGVLQIFFLKKSALYIYIIYTYLYLYIYIRVICSICRGIYTP
jgi:hypothetical protein